MVHQARAPLIRKLIESAAAGAKTQIVKNKDDAVVVLAKNSQLLKQAVAGTTEQATSFAKAMAAHPLTLAQSEFAAAKGQFETLMSNHRTALPQIDLVEKSIQLQQTAQQRIINSILDLELFPGSQNYFKSVVEAIDLHFQGDEEVKRAWETLTWMDIVYTVGLVAKYRDVRKREGRINLPPCLPLLPGQLPLHPQTMIDWGFFATAAYEENDLALRELLKSRKHELISHECHVGVFQPAHFLSMSLENNTIVIGIKGTSRPNDWMTNLFIAKEELRIKSSSKENNGEDYGIHAGVLNAARFIKERIGSMVHRAFYKAGFSVVVVGHSLGAGVAAALTILLREEMEMERVTCYAYAPPPCVSRQLATLSKEYIYSVVNGDDCIPRTGVAHLKNLAIAIRKISDIRTEQGGDWEKVEQMMDSVQWSELMERYGTSFVEKKFDTYLPGRILYLQDLDKKSSVAMEVASDCYELRLTTISPTMLTSHLMGSYMAALKTAVEVKV